LPGPRARAVEPKGESELRRYETILIAHVDLSEDELSSLTARYGAIVTGQKGILVKIERWGKRKLAYLIGKQARGFYVLIDYAGVGAVVDELERNLKIDDKVLKFMTVLKEEAIDVPALEKEIADAAAKKDEKKEAPVPEAATAAAGVEVPPPAAVEADAVPQVPEETNAKGEKES